MLAGGLGVRMPGTPTAVARGVRLDGGPFMPSLGVLYWRL